MDSKNVRSKSLNGPLLPINEGFRQKNTSFPARRPLAKSQNSSLPVDTEWYQGPYTIEREKYSFIPQTTSTIRFPLKLFCAIFCQPEIRWYHSVHCYHIKPCSVNHFPPPLVHKQPWTVASFVNSSQNSFRFV